MASELSATLSPTEGDGGGSGQRTQQQLRPLVNQTTKSANPYLLDHRDSLVAWQLLDSTSIERARDENKLIFLNIGYRACHRKSFSFRLAGASMTGFEHI